jgi:hypothetical protein
MQIPFKEEVSSGLARHLAGAAPDEGDHGLEATGDGRPPRHERQHHERGSLRSARHAPDTREARGLPCTRDCRFFDVTAIATVS